MIQSAFRYQSSIRNFDLLLFSVFYHDIIYDPSRTDNEEQSAAMAKNRLATLQVPTEIITDCARQIISTKTHSSSGDNDTNYLLDFDLMILGADWETYQKYAINIRKEYSIYSDLIYNQGRKKVLQSFLAKDRIFKTEEIHQKHEQQARQNIQQELEAL